MTLRTLTIQRFDDTSAGAQRQPSLWPALSEVVTSESSLMNEQESTATAADDADRALPTSSRISEALAAIEAARVELQSRTQALEAHYRQECAATLARLINAAAPSICEAAARDAIAGVFAEERGETATELFSIVASPDVVDVIRGMCAGRSDVPDILVEETMDPGTLEIRWAGGGLDCDVGRSLFAITEFLTTSQQHPQ
jgi:hypothetical protein